ncbi:MAG TPA: sensor histidine kinase, partial [Pricia sp.]|nr:sensor histidine kinase [Pricia sp.]
FTRTDIASLNLKMQKFKKEAYISGAIVVTGILFFLIIVHVLHKKNRNISKLNRTVENRLQERETLIKEIHHRVKNNLQVVASLLSLQSSFIQDEKIKMLFRYSQYRINSMGIVHEMLYKSDDLNRIDYGAYIKALVEALISSMKGDKSEIKLEMEVDNIFLNIDTSIPLGLMINEIITNSLKYGFSESQEGTISVALQKLGRFSYTLNIGDNGSGIPSHINFRNTKSLGLKLIHKLALQLRGNIEMDNSKKSTNYIITFQEIEQTS